MKRYNEQRLSELLTQFRQSPTIKRRLNEANLRLNWEALMGRTFANYTKVQSIKNGILYLEVDSAPMKHEIQFNKKAILKKLNEAFGEEYLSDISI